MSKKKVDNHAPREDCVPLPHAKIAGQALKDLEAGRIPKIRASRSVHHRGKRKIVYKEAKVYVLSSEEVDRLRSAVGHFTQEYATVRAQAAARERAFRDELAREIQPHLIEYLRSLPSSTVEDKQQLAKTANYETARLGLSFRVPKTGECGFLGADAAGDPNVGEFYFGVLRGNKSTKVRCDAHLPPLEVMAYDGSRDTKINWYERVEASRQGNFRKR
jgi:hypothetical protein